MQNSETIREKLNKVNYIKTKASYGWWLRRQQEDQGLKPARTNSSQDPI
jgi:hypothetical protein